MRKNHHAVKKHGDTSPRDGKKGTEKKKAAGMGPGEGGVGDTENRRGFEEARPRGKGPPQVQRGGPLARAAEPPWVRGGKEKCRLKSMKGVRGQPGQRRRNSAVGV